MKAIKRTHHVTPINENPDVGYMIQSIMTKNGWSLRDVADRAASLKKPFSYEHLRKIIKGNTTPSMYLLERIAQALDVDPNVLMNAQLKTTITRKFGREYLRSLNITEEMYEMDKLMKLLTPEQRSMVMGSIRALVQGNASKGVVPIRRR